MLFIDQHPITSAYTFLKSSLMSCIFTPKEVTTLSFVLLLVEIYYSTLDITYRTPLSIVPPLIQAICFIHITSFNFLTISRLNIIFILRMKKLRFNKNK